MRQFIIAVSALVAMVLTVGMLAGCGRKAVAVVDGRKITQEEFYQRLETMQGGRTLYDMIARDILTHEAEAQGIQVTAKQVDDDVAKWEQQAPSQEEFLKYLRDRGQSLEQFRDERAFGIMLEGLATRDVKVTDQDVREHFAKNREHYDLPAEWRVSEVVVATSEEATEVRRQLDDARASFHAVAQERSVAPSAAAGGALPSRAVGEYPEEWRSALASLKVGGISQPFQTEGGWRIVKLVEATPARPASLDDPDTRERIYQMLRMEGAKKPEELLREAILSGKHRVVIRLPRYKALETQFAPPPELPTLQTPGAPQPGAPSEGKEAPRAKPPTQPAAPAKPGGSSPSSQGRPTTE